MKECKWENVEPDALKECKWENVEPDALKECKWENVEPDALKEWKTNIFKIIDTRISFYSRNTHLLPPKPKSSFRHLKRGIQDFHMNYVLVPADKAANNVVVFDGCIILILLSVSLLTLMLINCSLL